MKIAKIAVWGRRNKYGVYHFSPIRRFGPVEMRTSFGLAIVGAVGATVAMTSSLFG